MSNSFHQPLRLLTFYGIEKIVFLLLLPLLPSSWHFFLSSTTSFFFNGNGVWGDHGKGRKGMGKLKWNYISSFNDMKFQKKSICSRKGSRGRNRVVENFHMWKFNKKNFILSTLHWKWRLFFAYHFICRIWFRSLTIFIFFNLKKFKFVCWL